MSGDACASCGGEMPTGARFCPTCGVPVQAPVGGEERRLVSVVFADIEGFTALAEHRDPESVKDLLDACLASLIPVVDAHGGHVDKVIGDEIMAVFGAPTSYEDDAERAVRAGLAMIDALAAQHPDLRLRVGINTGEVLAGAVGPAAGYTVTGDVVNTAHRLASAADPGEVLVADRTRQACVGAIRFRGHRVLDLKGKQEQVEAWGADRVLTVAIDPDAGRPRLPLVGRQGELDAVHRRTMEALEQSRAELIAVVGEPGVGKTRLAVELVERLAADAMPVRVVWATCSPYGTEGDLAPVGELVREALGIDRSLERLHQEATLRQRLGALGLGDSVIVRRLGDFIGLGEPSTTPVDAEPTTGRGGPGEHDLAAVASVLGAIAARHRLVVIVDDLHWAGSRMVRFLSQLPDRIADGALVVLALGRDDLLERHGPLLAGRRVTTRTLGPLSEAATAELVRSVLAGFDEVDQVGPDAMDRLVRAAGGNPLLAEQLVRFLVESGRLVPGDGRWTWYNDDAGSESSLPDGIRSLIGARLDALPSGDRALLSDAAVLGQVFWRSALIDTGVDADVVEIDRSLGRLEERGLIQRDPGGDRDAWRFRHSLTRDVAYAGIPLADRAEHHALAGRWIERRARTYLDSSAIASVAHHYERAVSLGRAVDHVDASLVRPAFAALVRAARDEHRREGLRRADRWYRRARAIGSPDPDEMIEAVAEHGQVLLELGQLDQAQEAFEELRRRAGSTRPPMAAFAEAHLGAVARLQGDVDLARERFQTAVARWRDLDDLQGVADSLRIEGWAEFTAGRPRAAVPRLERAAAIESQIDEPVRHSETLRYLGWCEYLDGRLVSAEEHLRTAMNEAQENREDGTAAFCMGLLGHLLLRSGRATDALGVARDLREIARTGSDPWGTWTCATLEAAALLALGDSEGAWTLGGEALARFEELDDAMGLGLARMVVAQSARARGDHSSARRILGAILETGRSAGVPAEDARALAELAALELEVDRLDEAERQARSSLALVRAGIGDDESGLKALRVLARVAVARGQLDAAELLLEEAAAPRNPGDRTEGWRLAAIALAEIRLQRGDLEGAEVLVGAAAEPPCDIVRVQGRLARVVRGIDEAR